MDEWSERVVNQCTWMECSGLSVTVVGTVRMDLISNVLAHTSEMYPIGNQSHFSAVIET